MSPESEVYDGQIEDMMIAVGRAAQRGQAATVEWQSLAMILAHVSALMKDRHAVISLHPRNAAGYCGTCRNSYRYPCPTLKAVGVQ